MNNSNTSDDFRDFSDDLLGKNSSRSLADNSAPPQSDTEKLPRRKRLKDLWDSL